VQGQNASESMSVLLFRWFVGLAMDDAVCANAGSVMRQMARGRWSASHHPLLERDVTKHRSRLLVGSTDRSAPFRKIESMVVRGDFRVDPSSLTFSAAG
jgi:hypothetical protein